ncbi:AsmA family protein [Urechidicola croceus]|uniref:AsmA domain-containing protein n=1 Tax=Urechidicola croceus TaxID=1850246 RepID=A0A1D8P524_9FLAO|nr:AsmA-like C-terminal region-containing protein [Urechidicola croceus]AOW19665.1 hypothetical protein LPB138_02760 [Urechidicola croceus]
MKKILKITGIVLLTISMILALIPFLFETQIKNMIKEMINQNVNAKVEFSDVDLSFFRSFPQAHVSINDLIITTFEPFKGDTLVDIKDIGFSMSIKELFKNANDDPIVVNTVTIDNAIVNLKLNEKGLPNYDITQKKDEHISTSEQSSFTFDIDKYSIQNSSLIYFDEASKTQFELNNFNHTGTGTFSSNTSELNTETDADVSLSLEEIKYLNNNHIILDALIDMNLNEQKYSFKENKAFINQLPLEFKGYVQLVEKGQQIDISFENPGSSFKDFLAVIPESYAKSIANVQTTGDFKVNGIIKGLVSDTTIPTMDINITSNNASFKYTDLPKRVENISINTAIKNTTGNVDDTFVAIKTLNFKIDDDVFKSSATLKNLTKNMTVNATVNGILNLANITKAYDFNLENELSGILKANVNTAFDMNSIETNSYQKIKNSGVMSVNDFVFTSNELKHPLKISNADLKFNPTTVTLNNFNATTGESDLKATGTITNLLGFLFNGNTLKGNFDVDSNNFSLDDFMVEDTSSKKENETEITKESIKIPSFLDCTINANVANVKYDNLNLKEVKGTLIIKDEQAILQNMTSNLFDGKLAVSGNVSSKTEVPTFNFNLGATDFNLAQSFSDLELFQSLAPIAKAFEGKLNTTINLSGSLDKEFIPNLNTVSGDAFAQLSTTDINTKEGLVLNKLQGVLNFVDFEKLDLKDLKTKFEFTEGKVTVKPFNINYKDIDIKVSGSHNFDKTMSYDAVFNVPAKYLGNEVNQLINKINDTEINKITIPVTANITGSYTNPQIKTDLTSGVTNLTKQLIEIEKQKLLNQGKDKISDVLGGLLNKNTNTNDTTKIVVIDSIPVEKKQDTTKVDVKKEVKDILGGLLKSKKKKTDSID